ncbi:MAG TPA: ATP-binding cassette domain-containing protein [Candidatus Thiothrix moscowensis]|uniref:ATP-binding cassette domain-containing protein n=1 Tax=unclassified Thiothrix TaxID=2636184 RepID=UPI0025E0C477|nr:MULTISPECIES: ATP-binding cassette domain-containing protein [unclassified Thiothrix]HRJ51835.1 ATP-binding cassette domain-containing protein [Candidatus Thiothrix moscowensis]HRJ92150.1 ATP-binding cassette domain-containing protein [Candidatus Thiothrix moscowensis]
MAILTLRNIHLENGDNRLFDSIDLSIEPGERLCLVGRNGTGKSTLMKLLCREVSADDGELIHSPDLKIARLQQDVPHGTDVRVFDIVAQGLTDLHPEDAWQVQWKVDTVLSRLQLDGEATFESLSGGWKRRALLARALVAEPDLLLLDEPTNHLDIPAIEWLENFLLGYKGTLLFVSHDRAFVQKLATRIIELDRGRLTSWLGTFQQYQERKQAALEAEAQQAALFDKRLAEEEVWIRQGIKARRTRNEGRVRRLEAMREEFRQRRNLQGKVQAQIGQADASGKVVIAATDLCYAWASKQPLIQHFSTTVMRGDKIGIIGANGVGKTTLIKLLLGQIQPDSGKLELGTRLQTAYFDQHRAQFDGEKNLRDNLAPGSDFVEINGQKRHIISYLQDFLFTPLQIQKPVKVLSGGERNRLLLARLFAQPSNLLVLDEPTNDLDAETLELLEELLIEYQGTLLLISHDRSFLNSVVTRSIVFENDSIGEYAGGYDDWLLQRPEPVVEKSAAKPEKPAEKPKADAKPAGKKKLSFKEQRELEQLPARLEQLEADMSTLQALMGTAAFYQQDSATITAKQAELAKLEAELEQAFARWEELEQMSQ